MSAFLGHIHYWLFNKIRLVIEREELIFQKAFAMCGCTAEELRSQVWETYGQPLPSNDLAELIDHTNIHGWLQRQIQIAESREAAFAGALIENCGQMARELLAENFASHGLACGEQAKNQGKYSSDSAEGIYQAMQDYFLSGMPCDQLTTVTISTPAQLDWEANACPKQRIWELAGIEAKTMRDFYLKWMDGFVKGINPVYQHALMADIFAGDAVNRHRISQVA